MSRRRRRSRSDPIRRDTPDALRPRREHEVAPRDREVARDARALGADRLLGDLDDDLLPFLEQRLDPGHLALPAPEPAPAVLVLAVEQTLVVEVVAHVQERRLLEADVDEARLHAGQHPGHAALRDHPRHIAIAFAFDVELGEVPALQQRDPSLASAGIDDDLVRGRGAAAARTLSIGRHACSPALASRFGLWNRVGSAPDGPAPGGALVGFGRGAQPRRSGRDLSLMSRNRY